VTGLARLAEARKAALATLHLDLQVPRLDPPVVVRVRPITNAEVAAITRRFRGNKTPDAPVMHNAAIIAEACLGVFGLDENGEPVEDEADWPRFDEELAEILGLDGASSAVDVVRGLYLTDGDVASAADQIVLWSGFRRADDSGN
jgi:hypothetical protein